MTYEYLCEACGHVWEAEQRISADPLKDCPKCGEPRAKRQISRGAGFILKGGGWYSDLYASSGSSSAAKSESDSSSSTSSGAASKTETTTPSKESSTPAATPSSSAKSE